MAYNTYKNHVLQDNWWEDRIIEPESQPGPNVRRVPDEIPVGRYDRRQLPPSMRTMPFADAPPPTVYETTTGTMHGTPGVMPKRKGHFGRQAMVDPKTSKVASALRYETGAPEAGFGAILPSWGEGDNKSFFNTTNGDFEGLKKTASVKPMPEDWQQPGVFIGGRPVVTRSNYQRTAIDTLFNREEGQNKSGKPSDPNIKVNVPYVRSFTKDKNSLFADDNI